MYARLTRRQITNLLDAIGVTIYDRLIRCRGRSGAGGGGTRLICPHAPGGAS